ncbi:glycosyltransferase family 2 protein [Fulvivirga sp. M361]|uniref:glycosyltransferase family 2 protein n=1 Tax=Fulvivirga sp. M361 TaxID=2594266 RepID=UPI00117B11FA|nr:glycosyltransferase family 2 protein [Fulvivirga sp. M361]TRX59559.1 glycosyltransferase family 2 protein [Fulvivirga sp. M361]
MDLIEFVFWISLSIIIYTYLGYGIVLYLLVKIKRILKPAAENYYDFNELPELTLIVACYNEADILDEKVKNTLELSYPEKKLNLYFVTDGSTDNSGEVLGKYERIRVFHTDKRGGKVAAVNRVMEFVTTPLVAFCDANTFLNAEAMVHLARHYKNSAVGAVAGEKKIYQGDKEHAAGSGEGAYWKYESFLKRMDSELGTVVGAAGELFSVRTDLYEMVPKNIIIEDFYLSMRIVTKGYKVVYEPDAYAMETGSASTKEEEKRKIRIAAGGIQSIIKLVGLLNFFKYGIVTFQYVSHRVLRWTLTPLLLPVVIVLNYLLLGLHPFYPLLFAAQLAFYTLSLLGYALRGQKVKFKLLFIPYYFTFMNWSVYRGFLRYAGGKQSAVWEKAKRA